MTDDTNPPQGITVAPVAADPRPWPRYFARMIDVLLFGFTQEAARIVEPGWTMNPVGNWWFILSIVFLFTPIIWFVTDRIIEPRLGAWGKEPDAEIQAELAKSEITASERKGLRNAGLAALVIVGGVMLTRL